MNMFKILRNKVLTYITIVALLAGFFNFITVSSTSAAGTLPIAIFHDAQNFTFAGGTGTGIIDNTAGVGGSPCVKFVQPTGWAETVHMNYAANPIDTTSVVNTDRLQLSIDVGTTTAGLTLYLNSWQYYITIPAVDHTVGYQTFNLDISSALPSLGGKITAIYFKPDVAATIWVDEISIVRPGGPTPTPSPTPAVTPTPTPTSVATATPTPVVTPTPAPTATPTPAPAGGITIFKDTKNFNFASGTGTGVIDNTSGVGGSPCVKFSGVTSYAETVHMDYSAAPISLSGVVGTDKIQVSIDVGTTSVGIVYMYLNNYQYYFTITGLNNTVGYQTYTFDMSSVPAVLGGNITAVYFKPDVACTIWADDISIAGGGPTPSPTPTPTPVGWTPTPSPTPTPAVTPTPTPSPTPTPNGAISLSLATFQGNKAACAIFTLDDCLPSHTVEFRAAFNAVGFKATWFIIPGRITDWSPWVAMNAEGHEIGNHSYDHWFPDWQPATIQHEVVDSYNAIVSHMGSCLTWAYPFGLDDPAADAVIFANERHLVSRYKTDPGGQNYIIYGATLGYNDFNAAVDSVINGVNVWDKGLGDFVTSHTLMSLNHATTLAKDAGGYDPVDLSNVQSSLAYVKSKENQIWVATYKDYYRYWKEKMNTTINTLSSTSNSVNFTITNSLTASIYTTALTTIIDPAGSAVPVNPQVTRDAGGATATVTVSGDKILVTAAPGSQAIHVTWQ